MIVSVIIPCYNVEYYIKECVDSVYQQTHQMLEVICVDNNSTDTTYSVLQALKKKYPNLIIEREEKKGASAARNKGLGIANGKWIQFLDADDLLMPDKIQHHQSLCQTDTDISFIAGSYFRQSVDGKSKKHVIIPQNNWIALASNNLGITSSNYFKKSDLLKVGGWDENQKSSQESDLMFRLLKEGAKVYHDKLPQTIVRDRESGSISQTNYKENLVRYIELRNRIMRHLSEISAEEDVINLILQILFDRIRELYKYNPGKSLELYDQIIPKGFVPEPSGATTKTYLFAYNLIGFKLAQQLKALFSS